MCLLSQHLSLWCFLSENLGTPLVQRVGKMCHPFNFIILSRDQPDAPRSHVPLCPMGCFSSPCVPPNISPVAMILISQSLSVFSRPQAPSQVFWPPSRQVTGTQCTEVGARQSWAEYSSLRSIHSGWSVATARWGQGQLLGVSEALWFCLSPDTQRDPKTILNIATGRPILGNIRSEWHF